MVCSFKIYFIAPLRHIFQWRIMNKLDGVQFNFNTFGYAFFSNQFKIINSDHSLFLFSLVSKSKYENNNRTHRETDPWSLPFTTSQYTLDSSYLWSNRAFLMNDVSNLNSYDLIQLRFCEEVWTHRRDCSVIAN